MVTLVKGSKNHVCDDHHQHRLLSLISINDK